MTRRTYRYRGRWNRLGRNSFIVSDHAAAHIVDVIAAAIRADRKQRKGTKRK